MEGFSISDNKTPHMALLYDEQVSRTIPNYNLFHGQIIDLVISYNNSPGVWLDTGSGTGTLVIKALEQFKDTFFILAEPSAEMLNIARAKLAGNDRVKFIESGSLELNLTGESIDVLTAVLSHHYFDAAARRKATENCFRILKKGGVYIAFENIRPCSEKGTQIGLERWKRFQLAHGKSEESVNIHLKRFNTKYFPITLDEHLYLLRDVGFGVNEVFWVSYLQAGFYSIKT